VREGCESRNEGLEVPGHDPGVGVEVVHYLWGEGGREGGREGIKGKQERRMAPCWLVPND
jgi:hypothetical protein